jgi:hypothetical protein
MKKFASALALAAIVGAPTAQAAEFDLGADYEFNAFTISPETGDDIAAIANRLRLKAHAKTDGGIQINTRFSVLNNFYGDDLFDVAGGTDLNAVYIRNAADNTSALTLDYGYLQMPLGAGWQVRLGRQESNFADCFNTCDDRRDRILVLGKVGAVTLVGTYDKFVEGQIFPTAAAGGTASPLEDDLDVYAGVAVGVTGGWLWSLLLSSIQAGDDTTGRVNLLDDAFLVVPYVKGKIGPVEVSGAYRYFDSDLTADAGNSAFIRAGYNLGVVNLEAQGVWVDEFGGVDPGWDTFSSQINNNPVFDRNFVSTALIGRDTVGGAVRVSSAKLANQFKVIGAAGLYDSDVDGPAENELTFVELRGEWFPTANTVLWATVGQLMSEGVAVDATTGATTTFDTDTTAYTLNVKTSF